VALDEIAVNPLVNLTEATAKVYIKSFESELYRKSKDFIMVNSNLDAFN